MFKNFHTFYHENAITAFQDYRARRVELILGRNRDLRLALIATEALFHLREHLPDVAALTRSQVQVLCPDYRILADTCNASKHKKLTKPTPGNLQPIVEEACRISELTVTIYYDDEQGEYVHHEKLVEVELADGTKRDIAEVLNNVVNFYEQHLKSKGVFTDARVFRYLDPYRYRTRSESSGMQLDLEITQGVEVNFCLKLFRFNRARNKAEPIDLSGSQFNGRVYKPNFSYDLAITHLASGKTYNRTVEIYGDDAVKMSLLSIDSERNAYAESIASVVAAKNEMIAEFVRNHPETIQHPKKSPD